MYGYVCETDLMAETIVLFKGNKSSYKDILVFFSPKVESRMSHYIR